jgi:hypothetical protein
MMARPPRCLRVSAWVYRLLLAAYPDSFRRKFGDEMAWVFDELAIEAWRRRGVVGLTTTWCRVLGDLARTAPREHGNLWRGGREMKTAVAAVLSVLLAIVIQYFIFIMVMMVGVPLMLVLQPSDSGISRSSAAVRSAVMAVETLLFCLAPFLTGLILTRVKPFFMPKVTAPLAAMIIVTVLTIANGAAWWLCLGAAAVVGLLTFLGCFVATKTSGRLDRIPIPASYWVGTLATLVCTFVVGIIVWLVRMTPQLDPNVRPLLTVCLAVLGLVAVATIANMVVFVARTRKRVEAN